MLKPSLQLKLGQTLTMTPQLQQAIRLLQLSSLELSAEIQEALESNPMLEVDDTESGEEKVTSEKSNDSDAVEVAAEEKSVDIQETSDIPDELPVPIVISAAPIADAAAVISRHPVITKRVNFMTRSPPSCWSDVPPVNACKAGCGLQARDQIRACLFL